jgi:ketosteroid isomerase-like protein
LEEFIRTGDFHSEDFDEGFEFDNSNAMIDADTYRGPAGLREYFALLRQMWEQFRFEPQEYIDAANGHVVVPMRLIAVGRDGVETSPTRPSSTPCATASWPARKRFRARVTP